MGWSQKGLCGHIQALPLGRGEGEIGMRWQWNMGAWQQPVHGSFVWPLVADLPNPTHKKSTFKNNDVLGERNSPWDCDEIWINYRVEKLQSCGRSVLAAERGLHDGKETAAAARKRETCGDAESRSQKLQQQQQQRMEWRRQMEEGKWWRRDIHRRRWERGHESPARTKSSPKKASLGLCRLLKRQRRIPRIHKTTVFPEGQ